VLNPQITPLKSLFCLASDIRLNTLLSICMCLF